MYQKILQNDRKYNANIDTIRDEMTKAYDEIKAAAKAIKSAADTQYNTETSRWTTYQNRLAREAEAERQRKAAAAANSTTPNR